ncbi:MAG: amino acid adenylation domain-containing protein [Pseudomonadota bacterium]
MSELTRLLEELSSLGIGVRVEDDKLRLDAPKGALTEDLRRRLVVHRDALMADILAMSASTGDAAAAEVARADPDGDLQPFALSDLQLGFYLADDPYMEYHVRPHAYSETDHDDLDVDAFTDAWNAALRRHRRELCIVNEAIELQLLPRFEPVSFPVCDLSDAPPARVEAYLARVRAEMARSELPLDRWPWFDLRITTWRDAGKRRSRIHYNHNNFFIDGFGTSKLLEEIDGYYSGRRAVGAPLTLSYRDAVLALERLGQSPEGDVARAYWFDRLPSLPAPPALPLVDAANRRRRSHLERRALVLDAPQWSAFKDTAASFGLTPSNAMIAAYACVLAEWSNSDHFVLSQMVTRRFPDVHPDLPEMLGNFASLYPLEIRLDAAADFVENARRIQHQVLLDLRHLQIGGMQVLQALNRSRGSFGSAPSPFVVGSGLAIRHYRKPAFQVLETSQTVLDHQFFELADGGLYAVWDLIEDCFPAGLIDEMWAAFDALLRHLAAEPGGWRRPVDFSGAIAPMATASQGVGSATDDAFWRPDARLHDALGMQAAKRGEAVAVVDARGALDYAGLDAGSAACAARLRKRWLGPGDRVAIMMDRGRSLAVAAFGVLRAGAAYVPIDPALPAERVRFLLEDCGAKAVLVEDAQRVETALPSGVAALSVGPMTEGRLRATDPLEANSPHGDDDAPQVRGDDLAYVIYTSGTTGRPKGVMIEHAAAMNTIDDVNRRFSIAETDRVFGVSSFGFDLSVYDLFGAVAAGATLVYPDPGATLDPHHWLDLLLRERVTVWNSVPALMSLLVEVAEKRGARLPELRLVLLSGDKIPLDLPDAVRAIAPSARIVSLGGATEASIWSIQYPIATVDPTWPTIPYGYPMQGQPWQVIGRHGRPCPRWVRGELCIGGRGLARGYFDDPEKTARSFFVDPRTGARWYRTGDLGRRLGDDCLQWMGRADFQIKLQGHRIEPGEIEAALQAHPAIADAVVAPGLAANGRQVLVAHIACRDGERVVAAELEAFLRGTLPAYMVPALWRVLPRLPVTANGKIDRDALARAPVALEAQSAAPRHEPPADADEARIRDIWQRVLRLDALGVTDDFFEIGGQSFDAIRIFAAIRQAYGQTYTLSDFWTTRTVRALATRVKRGESGVAQASGAVRINDARKGLPLFMVHPAGGSVMAYSTLGRRLDRPLYGLQITADPGLAPLRTDLTTLARHHVDRLRAVQPEGPYALGGWSTGAMLAFEIAAQLEAAGEVVRTVVLLDGPAPWLRPELADDELLVWFLQDLGLGLPVERLAGASLDGGDPDARLRGALATLGMSDDDGALAPAHAIFRDLVAAGARYVPGTVKADLVVVRVERDVVAEFSGHPAYDRPDWGWSAHASGRIVCERVPGTHYTLFEEAVIPRYLALVADA